MTTSSGAVRHLRPPCATPVASAVGLLLWCWAVVGQAATDPLEGHVGVWRTEPRPAYADTFHFELAITPQGPGYALVWTQRFASHPPRQIRQATVRPNADGHWLYTAESPIGRTRAGTVQQTNGQLVFEYREHDPSGRTARIRETFLRRGAQLVSERMIWRAGGWHPLTMTDWTLSARP